MNTKSYAVGQIPDMTPPITAVGFVGWLRKNLFSSWTNSLLTLFSLWLLYLTIPPMIDWMLVSANFSGTSKQDCTNPGACWPFVSSHIDQFFYGFYPQAERWRVDVSLILLVGLMIPLFIEKFPYKGILAAVALLIYPIVAYFLLVGDSFGLPQVETSLWGGFSLTLVISIVGIVTSLPIGIVLALGRRSNMPTVRTICTVFIELWRGVPLITVLFMSSVMLPLFLPEGVSFDKLLRALIGVSLFAAAYMAEVIRGGLQAIPKGQFEGAMSLGLSYWKTMAFIILPQALKYVIPSIVSTFIGLFKDTTLVLIIGLFDFLGIVQTASTDPKWLGTAVEGYVFTAIVYGVFCFAMSQYSQAIERKLDTGHKKK